MKYVRSAPFNDLPALPPPGLVETPAILKKAIAANRVLAELKGMAQLIPNQGILIGSALVSGQQVGALAGFAGDSGRVSGG